MEAVLRRRHALGVAEMMNFPAVIAGDPAELAKLADRRRDARRRPRARASAAAPWTRTWRPASAPTTRPRPTRRPSRSAGAGAWVLIREASNARNLRDLLPLVREFGPEFCAFCTDDREPDLLLREGHDQPDVPRGGGRGHRRPRTRFSWPRCTRPAATGSPTAAPSRPGYRADLLLLDDLRGVPPCGRATRTACAWSHGRRGRAVRPARGPGLGAADRAQRPGRPVRPAHPVRRAAPVRVIEIVPRAAPHRLAGRGADGARRRGRGRPGPRPGQDRGGRAPPRHRPGRRAASCAASGCSAARSATTVAHDAHNIVVVGRRRRRHGAVRGPARERSAAGSSSSTAATCVGELPLPVAGPAVRRAGRARSWSGSSALQELLRELGVHDRRAVHVAELPGASR